MAVDNGIGIYIGATLSDCDIIGCRVLGSSGAAGIYVDGGGAQFFDNHITTNASGSQTALTMASSNMMVMGNYFDHVNTGGIALVDASGTNRSTIVGNYFTDPPTSKPCILADNNFRGAITGNTFTADGGNSFVQSDSTSWSNTTIMGNFGRRGVTTAPNWVSEVITSAGVPTGSMTTPYVLGTNNYFAGNGSYLG
jgi:hypothetical protein